MIKAHSKDLKLWQEKLRTTAGFFSNHECDATAKGFENLDEDIMQGAVSSE